MKRLVVMLGLVGVLAAGLLAVAVAGAQEGTPEPSPELEEHKEALHDRFWDALAENLGITREELDAAVDETQLELIDQALADGRITEEQAEVLRERVANGELLFPWRHHRGHGPFLRGIYWIIENAAEVIGISEEELRESLNEGNSLATIAKENGVSVDDLKSGLLEAAEADLAEKVDNEELTQEQADRILQHLTENIDRIVNFEKQVDLEDDGEGLGERPRFRDGPAGNGRFPDFAPPFALPEDDSEA